MLRGILLGSAAIVAMSVSNLAWAGHGCGAGCAPGYCEAPACEPSYVERTVMVPEYRMETRRINCTVYKPETRQKTVMTYRCVPETVQKTCTYTVLVPEQRTKTVNYTVCRPVVETKTEEYTVCRPVVETKTREYEVKVPVWSEEEREYTVMVPHQETRSATRQVCKMVPVTKTRTVTCDNGHYETQYVEVPCGQGRGCYRHGCSPCGGCGGCGSCAPATRTICRRVWVPNVETKELEYTAYERHVENVPYEYNITVCKPETRMRTVKVCNYETETRTCEYNVTRYVEETKMREYDVTKYVPETRSKEVTYTVCRPEQREKTVNVTHYRRVPEEKVVNYTVMVPTTVEREVQVRVCHMVPKTIQVPACGGCYRGCGGCCH